MLDGSGWFLAQRWSSKGEGSWFFLPSAPHPWGTGCIKREWGASGAASAVHLGKNFVIQKLQGPPGASKLLDPKWGSGRTWRPCPSGTMVTHYEEEFIKSKLFDLSLIAILWGWTPPTLTPGSRGPKRGDWWGSGASAKHFDRNF